MTKRIECVFLNRFNIKDITSLENLQSVDTEIDAAVFIAVSSDNFNTVNLASSVLQELNKQYPGIESIELYLSKQSYKDVFSTNDPGAINLINGKFQELRIPDERRLGFL